MNHNSNHVYNNKVLNRDESLLLNGLHAKDEVSFSKLYKNYSAVLYGIINKIVKDKEEAEDVLQETFIKIIYNIHLYDDHKSRLFTWMSKVAMNKALDYIKTISAKNKLKEMDLMNVEESISNHFHVNSLNVETIGIKQLTSRLIPCQKQVIDLLYFQGYTQIEAAEKLNIPLGTVKSRNRLAILSLRKVFSARF